MSDDKPAEIGWLHYRLAVAFCAAFVTCITLLTAPVILSLFGGAAPLALYKFVFSEWGAAILLGSSVLGFIVGGERMANFFAFIWGTHPFWSELEGWLYEHETVAKVLLVALIILVGGGFIWYYSY